MRDAQYTDGSAAPPCTRRGPCNGASASCTQFGGAGWAAFEAASAAQGSGSGISHSRDGAVAKDVTAFRRGMALRTYPANLIRSFRLVQFAYPVAHETGASDVEHDDPAPL